MRHGSRVDGLAVAPTAGMVRGVRFG